MIAEIEGYMLLGNDGEAFEHVVQNGFLLAKKEIWFTSAKTTDFMIPNPHTKEAFNFSHWLVRLRDRGVKINFILSPRERERKVYQKLKNEENIEFRFCYDLHLKVILTDNSWLYFGSANLTGAGLGSRTRKGRNNFEIGVITTDRDAIMQVERLLLRIWTGAECQNCYQKNRGYCKGIEM